MRPPVPALPFLALPLLALPLLAAPAAAGPIEAGGPDCGGDAFSSAQVVERQAPRRGPVAAVPETLCADLAPWQPPTRVDIYANSYLAPEIGGRPRPAPYGGRLPPAGGPPRPRE